ncbi:MAG: hypothetical protein QOD39_64 [Mycobacterium sp.]|jgi:hypothetical protein|nr:hypothetical protein [Mycobacterium sp.]
MAARRETLLSVHRQPTDCIFKLLLTLDPDGGDRGVSFSEYYDYGPLGDDAGREYAYTAYAPYSALEALVGFFEGLVGEVGEGAADGRLVDCFTRLVARGELADGTVLKGNFEKVLAWFEAAGVPAASDTWFWMNSD